MDGRKKNKIKFRSGCTMVLFGIDFGGRLTTVYRDESDLIECENMTRRPGGIKCVKDSVEAGL